MQPQQLQALESAVKEWFKPLAYSIILMSEDAYPCVFYPDLFGAEYKDIKADKEIHIVIPKVEALPKLLETRQKFAYGEQINYFDHPNCIAWIRKGDDTHQGCVVILSNSDESFKEVDLGIAYAHSRYRDYLQHREQEITTDENGIATFWVNAGSVSIWYPCWDTEC